MMVWMTSQYTKKDCMALWRSLIRTASKMREDITPTYWHTTYINMQPFLKILKIMQKMDTSEYGSTAYNKASKELDEMRNIWKPMN